MKIYIAKYRKTEGKKEEERKKAKERRKRKRIEERVLRDRLLLSEEKAKKLRMSLAKADELRSEEPEDQECVQVPLEQIEDLRAEASEEEEEAEKNIFVELEQVCEEYLRDPGACQDLTSLDLNDFEAFVLECSPALDETTYRGTQRKRPHTSTQIPYRSFIFLTLFWLQHYLTIKVLFRLFKVHPRTCTRILKRTSVALAKTLENDIRFPSDEEMDELRDTEFQNLGFSECVCVVDGTEIRISRPKNAEIQTKTYSGKKKQNSLNVMVVTKLNGEIIYYSPLRVGAHDQSHWNELKLRDRFVDKEFGIMGDGGFTFNVKGEEELIHGFKPHKKPRRRALTNIQKRWNTKLSEVRVVVENSIRVIKTYKILSGVFRHWRNGKGQINGNHILTICVALANRRIKKKPLRAANWKASDFDDDDDLLLEYDSDRTE